MFQQFDTEGNGTADVSSMMEALKNSNSANMSGELGYVVRTLQACSLTPGRLCGLSGHSHLCSQSHHVTVLS